MVRASVDSGVPSAPVLELEIRVGWRKADPAIEAGTRAFWQRLDIVPAEEDLQDRLQAIVLAVFAGDFVVAVASARVRRIPFVRANLAMLRVVLGPRFQSAELSDRVAKAAFEALAAWSRENPTEEVMGVGILVPPEIGKSPPREPVMGLTLSGFTDDNDRLMVAWFDHAMV